MRVDCVSGLDEANCPYKLCGEDAVVLEDSCYQYVRQSEVQDDPVTWTAANAECAKRGGVLAMLKTPHKWDSILKLLRTYWWFTSNEVAVGLKTSDGRTPYMYRYILQWTDSSPVYFMRHKHFGSAMVQFFRCGYISTWVLEDDPEQPQTAFQACKSHRPGLDFVCEVSVKNRSKYLIEQGSKSKSVITLKKPSSYATFRIQYTVCPNRHITHLFLACDVQSDCWSGSHDITNLKIAPIFSPCSVPLSSLPSGLSSPPSDEPPQNYMTLAPYFVCSSGGDEIPYSLVCNRMEDCRDASDEDFCVFPPCLSNKGHTCRNQQCVRLDAVCDGYEDCLDGSDETCSNFDFIDHAFALERLPLPPAVINMDGKGSFNVQPLNVSLGEGDICPETHFQCPGDGYCLPVYVRCNGISDCPGKEDEEFCDKYTCPGLYRCRASRVCLHAEHVCDGWAQCPQHDDELFCNLTCPHNCMCHGLAFICPHTFPADDYLNVRYLDAGGSGMSMRQVQSNSMLIHLGLARCGLETLQALNNPNLHSLDLSDNRLSAVSERDVSGLPRLRALYLAGNPLASVFVNSTLTLGLLTLDLSRVEMAALDTRIFAPFPELYFLNLSDSGVETVLQDGFGMLTDLRLLDVRGCPMSDFPKHVFKGLDKLQYVYADNYKLCCPGTLPADFDLKQCWAPFNEISSCEALLRSDTYRGFLAVFACLATTGNLVSFVWRVFMLKSVRRSAFALFITNLCVADLLMGVYLVMVGVADHLYLGTYLWQDTAWRHSSACQVAGFLSLLSSEVSAFIICLITLDRFLVLRFPMSGLHFNTTSAWLACLLAWIAGVCVSGTPLLPAVSHWRFYSQTGICLPLPVTRNRFPGQHYAFGIMIVLNFVLFLLIGVGQAFVYLAIRTNSLSGADTTKKSQNLSIARRLLTIVMTDFLCWFPIGLLGLLATQGVPVPGEVNVGMAIFVLPLNSALNPFLYTLSAIRERRRQAIEELLRKRLEAQLAHKERTGCRAKCYCKCSCSANSELCIPP